MYLCVYIQDNRIGDVTVSVLASSAVDRVFIGDVTVSVLASSAVDRVFIGGVTVSVLASSAVDRVFIGGVTVSVDRVFEPRLDKIKDYKNGSCFFTGKHSA
jgi:precorrin-6B methylase 2